MRRIFTFACFTLLALSICGLNVAQAETAPVGKPIDLNSQIGRYVLSRPMLAEAHKLAVAQDRSFAMNCESQYSILPQTISVLQPIEMPDGGERPTSGIWQIAYDAKRCDTAKRYNALYVIRGGAAPMAQALVPGGTAASAQLMIDTIKLAAPALLSFAKDCKDIRVVDTRIVGTTAQPVRVLHEEWQFLLCGEKLDLPINFVPTADGGTDIQFKAPMR